MPSTETVVRDWTRHYRSLTAPELVTRTLHLRIADKHGHAGEVDERFAALEAEQTRRAEDVVARSGVAGDYDQIAHEEAFMENERRWAASLDLGFSENADAIRDLAVQVVRNYRRLAYDIRISRYSRQALAASRELQAEFDVQVNRGANGQWVLEFI